MRYCIFFWLSVTTTFLQADWAINGLWNKYHHGELYPYLTKTNISFYGIPLPWVKTELSLPRNKENDKILPNIIAVPQDFDLSGLKDNKRLSISTNNKGECLVDLSTTESINHLLIKTGYTFPGKKRGEKTDEYHSRISSNIREHLRNNVPGIIAYKFYQDNSLFNIEAVQRMYHAQKKNNSILFWKKSYEKNVELLNADHNSDMRKEISSSEEHRLPLEIKSSDQENKICDTVQPQPSVMRKNSLLSALLLALKNIPVRIAAATKAVAQLYDQKIVHPTIKESKSNVASISVLDKSVLTAKQTNNTCAFHALKNGYYLFKGNDAGLQDDGSSNTTKFNLVAWQTIVGKNRDLDEDEIKKIITVTNLLKKEDITIISNISEFSPTTQGYSDAEFDAFCSGLQKLKSGHSSKHVYLLANMKHKKQMRMVPKITLPNTIYGKKMVGKNEACTSLAPSLEDVTENDESTVGEDGHWIAAVVMSDKSGKIAIECADSLHNTVHVELLDKLKYILGTPVIELKIQRDLGCYLPDTVQTPNTSRLRNLVTMVEIARQKKYHRTSYFITVYMPQILHSLDEITRQNTDLPLIPHPPESPRVNALLPQLPDSPRPSHINSPSASPPPRKRAGSVSSVVTINNIMQAIFPPRAQSEPAPLPRRGSAPMLGQTPLPRIEEDDVFNIIELCKKIARIEHERNDIINLSTRYTFLHDFLVKHIALIELTSSLCKYIKIS